MEEQKGVKGRWKKGESGNKNGRPKKTKCDQNALNLIYEEANGDPIIFQKLVLQNGHRLGLDLTTALRLSKELAPYEKPKLSSVDTKNTETVINYMISDPTQHLEQEQPIKTVEHIEPTEDE